MSTHRDKTSKTTVSEDDEVDSTSDTDSGTRVNSPFSLNTSLSRSVSGKPATVDFDTEITAVTGAWGALQDAESVAAAGGSAGLNGVKGLKGTLPAKFTGLATPEKNPMSMQVCFNPHFR